MIIVREQHVKNELPDFMRSMLCLTVYESKGLEFDDVILFNFFAMGEIRSALWKLLKMVSEEETHRSPLPDWVLRTDPEEQKLFVEDAVDEAVRHHREAAQK